jgi:hypothetical protein
MQTSLPPLLPTTSGAAPHRRRHCPRRRCLPEPTPRTAAVAYQAAFRCPRRRHHLHLAAAPANAAIHDATAHHAIPQRRRLLSSRCPFRLNSRRYHELPPEQGVATTTSPSSSRPSPPCACLFQWWCPCPWWWMVRQCVQHC